MSLLQSRTTSVLDQPPRTLSRRGSLPANFILCASPSAQASTSSDEVYPQKPMGLKQRPRSQSLPARPDGSSVSPFSNSSPALTTPPSGRARARPRNHDQSRSTPSKYFLFYTGWKEVGEGEVGNKEVKQEAEEDKPINNLATASHRRFSFRDPPQRDGLVVLTLSERLALAQPAPGAQRSARRPFTRRPSLAQRPISADSSSGDADDEASDTPPSSGSSSHTDEESLSPPESNKKTNHPQQPLFPPHPPLEINLRSPNHDNHTSTLNNPRLHIGELAHPPPPASGAAYPVFRTTPGNRRLSEAGPRRRKSVVVDGATMPALYLRRVEGGGVALSEGCSSVSSVSLEEDGGDDGGGEGDEEGGFEGSQDVTLQESEEGTFEGSGDVTLRGSSSGGGGDENGGLAQLQYQGMAQYQGMGGALEENGGEGEAGDEIDIDAI
ncbi:hypothetical protein F5144DRAFT_640770 [Chaetomium tenue]|uniref:Uncharacterized protein n=1 Tax=Chaetomium tenue TaxID=1854479 RepID=A0ACB7PJV8_9PEZI|nr:hypothetical protein F5144DRAFT_640770 [Chaetomium globosum]